MWIYCLICGIERLSRYIPSEWARKGWIRVSSFEKKELTHIESYDYICPHCAKEQEIVGIAQCPRCQAQTLCKGIAFCPICYRRGLKNG
jgi:hypothetical protein